MSELFDAFWRAYPRRVGKGNARKAWAQIRPDAEMLERMIDAIESWKRTEQWQASGGKFIPHPATWLNREGWDDEPEVELTPRLTESQRRQQEWEQQRLSVAAARDEVAFRRKWLSEKGLPELTHEQEASIWEKHGVNPPPSCTSGIVRVA